MTKTELKSKSMEELLSAYYFVSSRITKEANFGRKGVTKRTIREQEMIIDELGNRLDIDVDVLKELIDK